MVLKLHYQAFTSSVPSFQPSLLRTSGFFSFACSFLEAVILSFLMSIFLLQSMLYCHDTQATEQLHILQQRLWVEQQRLFVLYTLHYIAHCTVDYLLTFCLIKIGEEGVREEDEEKKLSLPLSAQNHNKGGSYQLEAIMLKNRLKTIIQQSWIQKMLSTSQKEYMYHENYCKSRKCYLHKAHQSLP